MKKWISLIVAICLVSVVLTGCEQKEENTQETAEITRSDLIIGVSVSGNLEMPHKTNLSFGTTGTVVEVLVDEGDSVVKGQTLARLDAQSLELGVETTLARYKVAKMDYGIAQNNLMQTIYPHYITGTTYDLPGTRLALEEAHGNLEDTQKFMEQGKTEEAQASLDLLGEDIEIARDKSQSRTWQLPFSIKVLELQTNQVKIAMEMAEMELARARLELDKTVIVATFDSVVAEVNINEGQELSAMTYANTAVHLIDPSEIEMSGVIDEIDIAKVKLGQEADIILDALPGKEVKGRVTFISQAGTVQAGVVSYKTTITLEHPEEELRDSMSATAGIIIDRRDNVLLIANRAIQGSWENPAVEVIIGEQTEQRQVTLGMSDGIKTEVLSGLEEGERVIFPKSQLPFNMFGG